MPAQLEEITAEFLYETHRFDNVDGDVIVGSAHANGTLNAPITIKGPAEIDELRIRHTYRFYGRWSNYTNPRTKETEKQFHFQTFVIAQPHNREGVIAYLRHAGQGFGFGAARAAALWDAFGSDAVRMMRENSEVALANLRSRGLPMDGESVRQMVEALTREQSLENCTIELTELLTGRGLPKTTARKAIQEWGNLAAAVIRRDPYQLMRFRNCGFKRCDQLYLHLRLPPGRLKRQALAAWYALASNTEGHTWFPRRSAEFGIRATVAGAELQIDKALDVGRRARVIAELRTDGLAGPITPAGNYVWVAEGTKARNESQLAAMVADAMTEACNWPSIDRIENIDGEQPARLAEALTGPIAILGGSPGTGKTFVAANLVKSLIQHFGQAEIGIGAPTGKAAVRLTEALQGYGIGLRARTWHSLLGVESAADRGGWGFKHCEANPLPFKVLIGDETSMNDTDLAASIFRARAKGTHVLLVGDINQLPPVGHGAPLRDLIAAGLPYGELREIRRNSGGIVEACAAIRDGRRWEPDDNLNLVETGLPEQQIRAVLKTLAEARAAGLDPVWDCQVLAAVNAKSQLSRKELNKVLQAELNQRPGVAGQPFRVGDKIVNTKNGYFPIFDADTSDEEMRTNERGEVYVANGELAEVIEVEEKLTVAKLTGPHRIIKIPRGKAVDASDSDSHEGNAPLDGDKPATGCSWELGYCLSVHKFQGSESEWAIVLGDEYPGAKMVCDRAWCYTAISRAKKRCVMIGRKSTFDSMCRRQSLAGRKTLLKEQILLNLAKAELASM